MLPGNGSGWARAACISSTACAAIGFRNVGTMNDGFQFIDIIFFAMVAAFLVLRLRSVLGRRTGQERPREGLMRGGETGPTINGGDNVVELPERRRTIPEGPQDRYAGTPVAGGLSQIRMADPGFNADEFLAGAKAAFEMILGAYAASDVKALKPLLNAEVLRGFEAAIADRAKSGDTLETELISFKSAEIVEAATEGRRALVTVRFVTEQVNALRDAQGQVVDGDPNRISEVVDVWTFARDTRARDPNWQLVATRSPEE